MKSIFDDARRALNRAAMLLAGCALACAAAGASAQIILRPPDLIKVPLPNTEDFVSISDGSYHTCATKYNGN